MLAKIIQWLRPKRPPEIPEVHFIEEFLPSAGCLQGDDARRIVMYANGTPLEFFPYHPALAERLEASPDVTFTDLTGGASTGPDCIGRKNVILDLVNPQLRRGFRVWNVRKAKRRMGQ